MVALIVFMGLKPGIFLDTIEPAAERIVKQVHARANGGYRADNGVRRLDWNMPVFRAVMPAAPRGHLRLDRVQPALRPARPQIDIGNIPIRRDQLVPQFGPRPRQPELRLRAAPAP
jgi:hypothetical protein